MLDFNGVLDLTFTGVFYSTLVLGATVFGLKKVRCDRLLLLSKWDKLLLCSGGFSSMTVSGKIELR